MQKHAIGVKLKENPPHLKLESLPTYDEDLVSSRRGAALSLRYLEKKRTSLKLGWKPETHTIILKRMNINYANSLVSTQELVRA